MFWRKTESRKIHSYGNKRIRDGDKVTVHSNPEKTVAGSRHYIHAEDVANALLFLSTLTSHH